jgi:hypothetical protein
MLRRASARLCPGEVRQGVQGGGMVIVEVPSLRSRFPTPDLCQQSVPLGVTEESFGRGDVEPLALG